MKRLLAAMIIAAGALAGCEMDTTNPGAAPTPSEAELAKKPKRGGGSTSSTSFATPHVLQFATDVESAPIANVMLNASAPFSNVAHPTTPITLPDVAELVGCGLDQGGSWTPYAGDWSGYLALTGDGSTATLNYVAYAADGTPFWLSVSGSTTTRKVETSTVLTFTDVTAIAKMDQYPLVVIMPCATFSITATPQ